MSNSKNSRKTGGKSTSASNLQDKEANASAAAKVANKKAQVANAVASKAPPTTPKASAAKSPKVRKENVPPAKSTPARPGTAAKSGGSQARTKQREVEEQLKRVEALYEEEKARNKKLRQRAIRRVKNAVQEEIDNDKIKIPRPAGSAGDDYSLKTEMRLDKKPEQYKACRRAVKRCVDKAGLDETLHLCDQDQQKLAYVYKAARDACPYLKRFERDWASKDFVRMLMRNRRQQAKKRAEREAAEQAAAAAAAEDDDLYNFGSDMEVDDEEGEEGSVSGGDEDEDDDEDDE